jgi:hypothetical protein
MVRNGSYMVRMTRHDPLVNEGGGNKHVQLTACHVHVGYHQESINCSFSPASIVCCKQSNEGCFGLVSGD